MNSRGVARDRATLEGVEDFTEADIISGAVRVGESVVVEGPTPEGTGVMALVQGKDQEPYVVEADVPVLEAGARRTPKVVANSNGVIGVGGDAEEIHILPGMGPDLAGGTATLAVRGRSGRLFLAGRPTTNVRLVAENGAGKRLGTARIRFRLKHGPYRKLGLVLPRGTRWIVAYGKRSGRRLFQVAANQPVREVVRSKSTSGGPAEGDGMGRPTP